MPFIIAITGGSGSGKGTLSASLHHIFGDSAVYLSTDFYYKGREPETSIEEYLKRNFDHPDALLLDRFARDVNSLFEGKDIRHPEMDFSGGTFIRTDDAVEVKAKPIIILEGIFCLHNLLIKELVKDHGYSIFAWAPTAVLQRRVALRDAEERHLPYTHTLNVFTGSVMTGYYSFVKPHKRTCNLLLPTWSAEEKDIPVAKLTQTILDGILSKFSREFLAEQLSTEFAREIWPDFVIENN